MTKILFLIHDLGPGGAEKVLVNLVNNMDMTRFDVTVMTLFDTGVNRQFLNPKITYKTWCKKPFRGNSHLMKLLSPKALHRMIVREKYDIEVAYLEGPCARVISGCTDPDTKKVAWIHCTMKSERTFAGGFRSVSEARACYGRMDRMIFVSDGVRKAFLKHMDQSLQTDVLYNTNESKMIQAMAQMPVTDGLVDDGAVRLIAVGKIMPIKGFDRLARIHRRLLDDGHRVHSYILGTGEEKESLIRVLCELDIEDTFSFLGYQTNPYQYVAKCDLFVCASYAEGFSTAATEALIVGTPVCTVEVSGMREMLGENEEYGIITANDEEALYRGIKRLLDDPELLAHYRKQAEVRGQVFSTEKTVQAVEVMLEGLEA